MPRRVDDVERYIIPRQGRVLREDRDSLFALEIHRVHHSFCDRFVRAKRARLAQHRVNESCLSVVDVGDDRYVAKVRAQSCGGHNIKTLSPILERGSRAISIEMNRPANVLAGSTSKSSDGIPHRNKRCDFEPAFRCTDNL